ncbi:4588_t:CDS:2 [Entrophospora sp. SA101]|nr:4588_t:CDS:2 [Entrophospora sp. SA101]
MTSIPIPPPTTRKLTIQTANNKNNIKTKSSPPLANSIKLIDYTEFEDVITLNTECYGLIKEAYWRKEEIYVHLKFINDLELEDQLRKIGDKSNQIIQQSRHPNIIQFYGVSQDQNKNNYFLVLQRTNNGNLREYLINNQENLKWIDKLRLATDIAAGLNFLHYPQHIFINNSRALIHNPNLFSLDDDNDIISTTTPSFKNSVPGVIPYIDPQMLDIYSLGVILWEISTNKIPFNDSKNQVILTVSIMLRNKREVPAEGVPECYVGLYQNCWDDDPKNRPYINYVYDELSKFLGDELNKRFMENIVDEKDGNIENTDDLTIVKHPEIIFMDHPIEPSNLQTEYDLKLEPRLNYI